VAACKPRLGEKRATYVRYNATPPGDRGRAIADRGTRHAAEASSRRELGCAPIRVLGLPIESPQTIVNRVASDVGAIARLARSAPEQLDRLLELGEELTALAHRIVDIAERLDRRAEALTTLGDQLDGRAQALLELGGSMRDLGERVDARGAEIVDRATAVVETGSDLIGVLPALERALEMATPLEARSTGSGGSSIGCPGGSARPGNPQRPGSPQRPKDPPRAGDPPRPDPPPGPESGEPLAARR